MNSTTQPRNFSSTRAAMLRDYGITFAGVLLFIISLSVIGSGFTSTRIRYGGLYIHPFLIFVGLMFPLVAPTRINTVPLRLFFSLLTFASLYYVSTFAGGIAISDGIKIAASVVTILTMYMLVDRYKDFELGVLGLLIAISVLGLRAMLVSGGGELSAGMEVLEGSNRNTYSLYALGPILLAGHILLNQKVSFLVRMMLIGGIGVSTIVICLSLNRSGWLCLFVILLMLLRRNRFQAALLIGCVAGIVITVLTMFYQTKQMSERLQSDTAKQSDATRVDLILHGFQIALENPLLGVSPQVLEYRLARYFGYLHGAYAAHNVYAYLAGGSGFICLGLLFWIGRVFWTWPPPLHPTALQQTKFNEARRLLRMLLILWAIRGFFTHEIIYSPGFCMTLGLTAGLCKVYSQRR